jgi:hypothetical protein
VVVVVLLVLNFSFEVLVKFVWFGTWVLFASQTIGRVWKLPLEVVEVGVEPVALRRLRSWLALRCGCEWCELKLPA